MPKYQGHKNWNHWNVSLWINNDESLYRLAQDCVRDRGNKRDGAAMLYRMLEGQKTPDDAPYTASSVRAAMVGM